MHSSQRSKDRRYMKRALALARQGSGSVAPNPMVGCVIVKNDRIIGEGYHEFFGGPHAEVNALAEAGARAKGSTLYATLEPCDHFGKTPPCTETIIAAGVKRVVVAMRDPNPKVRGRGIAKLRRHAIPVSPGMLGGESMSLNSRYIASVRGGIGPVIAKAAMSLDGKIATARGSSQWITSPPARSLTHRTRSAVDAVIVGRKTVQRDNPSLTSHGTGHNPVRVVIDPHLKTSLQSRAFDRNAPKIVVHSTTRDRRKLETMKRKRIFTMYLPSRRGRIPFGEIIGTLRDYGMRRILIEGGGETLAAAFEANVVTDVMFFVAPRILGGRAAKTPGEGMGAPTLPGATELHGLRARPVGPDLLLTGKVKKRRRRS